jgi:hypothetical protein
MATAAISSNSIFQELQQYFQERGSDQQALGQALQSGDLAGAQQEYNAIQTLAQSGPFANGGAYKVSQRQQDFAAIGQALQAGDLTGAQQAFAQLQATFKQTQPGRTAEPPIIVTLSGSPPLPATAPGPTASPTAATAPASGGGSEIVLNLGNITPGEQITIGVSNSSNGGEQVTIGVANQQNQAPEQITLNLAQNSNQEIVLNLFNSLAGNSAQGSGVNVTA